MRLAILLLALPLGACAFTAQQDRPTPSALPPPIVDVQGPRFSATTFECGVEPAPPGADADPAHQGSVAAHDRTALSAWGRGCAHKLSSVGRRLDAAGLVNH